MDWEADFAAYRTNHNSTVSVNWHRPLSDILITDDNNAVVLSPSFIEHAYQERNWTVGPELAEALPYLDCIPLHPS